MSLSKSKCWYSNNCLHFLNCYITAVKRFVVQVLRIFPSCCWPWAKLMILCTIYTFLCIKLECYFTVEPILPSRIFVVEDRNTTFKKYLKCRKTGHFQTLAPILGQGGTAQAQRNVVTHFLEVNITQNVIIRVQQGALTEREGLVRLTSSLRQVVL